MGVDCHLRILVFLTTDSCHEQMKLMTFLLPKSVVVVLQVSLVALVHYLQLKYITRLSSGVQRTTHLGHVPHVLLNCEVLDSFYALPTASLGICSVSCDVCPARKVWNTVKQCTTYRWLILILFRLGNVFIFWLILFSLVSTVSICRLYMWHRILWVCSVLSSIFFWLWSSESRWMCFFSRCFLVKWLGFSCISSRVFLSWFLFFIRWRTMIVFSIRLTIDFYFL